MVVHSHLSSIHVADSANTKKVHKELMHQVRTKATHIISKYKIQVEPLHFEWDKFLPTLEKDFAEVLNEVLSDSNNQQQPNSNENRSTPNANRNQHNTGINNRTRMLTTLSLSATHTNRSHGFQHMSHLKLIYVVETVVLQTTLTRELKIEDMPITQHYSDHHIHVTQMVFQVVLFN